MKKFRVIAKMTTYAYVDIDAEDKIKAKFKSHQHKITDFIGINKTNNREIVGVYEITKD